MQRQLNPKRVPPRRQQLPRQPRRAWSWWPLLLFPLAMIALAVPFFRSQRQATTEAPALPPLATALPPTSVPAAALPADTPLPLPTLQPTAVPAPPTPTLPTAPPGSVTALPILMYHYVRVVDAAADPLGYNLSVTPAGLDGQLAWLAAEGYTPLRMDEALRCLQGGAGCPQKPIALTFDDGYADALSEALPLLQKYGFVATFYIVSGFVGEPGYLTADEVRTIRAAGMEIGAHTINHRDLSKVDEATARAEVIESKAQVEAISGGPVHSFCYPSGKYTDATLALVREAGYDNATTVMPDLPYDDRLQLPRIRIRGDLDQAGFEGLVSAYTSVYQGE